MFPGAARDTSRCIGLEGVDAEDKGRQPHRQVLENHIPGEFHPVQRGLLDLLRTVRDEKILDDKEKSRLSRSVVESRVGIHWEARVEFFMTLEYAFFF